MTPKKPAPAWNSWGCSGCKFLDTCREAVMYTIPQNGMAYNLPCQTDSKLYSEYKMTNNYHTIMRAPETGG